MPRIPSIESQRSLPTVRGVRRDNNAEIQVANQLSNLGEAFQQIEQANAEKKARVSIYEAETALRKSSMELLADTSQNRLGKNALPDKETGYTGVYDEYLKFGNQQAEKVLADIDPRFQQAARERLGSVVSSYGDQFLLHQTKQQAIHRQETLHSLVNTMQEELNLAMASGANGGVEDIKFTYQRIEELTRQEAQGGKVEDFLAQKKSALFENAILQASGTAPEKAMEMLLDKETQKTLTAAQKKSLQSQIESDTVKVGVERAVGQIMGAGLSYQGQMALADTLPKGNAIERDIHKRVVGEIEAARTIKERIKAENQSDLIASTWQEIVGDGNQKNLTPETIATDPRFSGLEVNQKDYLRSLLKKEKDPTASKATDFFLRSDAEDLIFSGRLDEAGVKQQVVEYVNSNGAKGIPPQYGQEMLDNVKKYRDAPQIGGAAQILKDENDFDKEDQAKFNEVFYREVRSTMARNDGKPLDYTQILEIGRKLAKPINEAKWFPTPRFKDENFRGLGAEEDAIMAPVIAKKNGWDFAQYDEQSGYWYGRKGDKSFRHDPTTGKTFEFIPK